MTAAGASSSSPQEGNCDPAYRYPLRIADGKVLYDGQNDFAVSGNVSGSGTVNVSISRGESKANGSGRLTASGGTGKWTGKSVEHGMQRPLGSGAPLLISNCSATKNPPTALRLRSGFRLAEIRFAA